MTGRVNNDNDDDDDDDDGAPTLLQPGESNRALSLAVGGELFYCCQLSTKMSLFTLYLDGNSQDLLLPHRGDMEKEKGAYGVLDIILKFVDGWDLDRLDYLSKTLAAELGLQKPQKPLLRVTGYLERMRRKFTTDSAPLCLHAQTIHLWNGTKNQASTPTPPKQITLDRQASIKHHDVPDTNKRKRNKNTDRGANDGSRFGKLVQFILQEFGGYDVLAQKPILDIAGGAGGLAFELSVRHAIPTIVVDTKTIKWKSQQLNCLAFRRHNLQQLSNTGDGNNGSMADQSPLVQCLRNRFQSLEHVEQFQTWLETSWVLSLSSSSQTNGIMIPQDKHHFVLDDAQQKLHSIVHNRDCSLLIGLHADQATHPIIDIGLALSIPWVVIPCCVFPNLFQQRTLKSGRPVKSYEDLCAFILEQDPAIQEAVLPFRGRNRAFYWHPPDDSNHSENNK